MKRLMFFFSILVFASLLFPSPNLRADSLFSAQGSVVLTPGFNLLGLPVDPADIPQTKALLQSLGSPDQIGYLRALNTTDQIFQATSYDQFGDVIGTSVPIHVGDAWVVYARTPRTISYDVDLSCPIYVLEAGANLVQFPYVDSEATSYGMLDALGPRNASSIQGWDDITGSFRTAGFTNGTLSGSDFPIIPGRGYFLFMHAAATYDSTLLHSDIGSAACGSNASATISGRAIKGPISNGTVTAYAVTSGSSGIALGATTTDADGDYLLTVENYTGPLLLEVTGGSYVDEVTGTLIALSAEVGAGLQVVIGNIEPGSDVEVDITPLTTMAMARAQQMSGGLTAANIDAANHQIGSYFGGIDLLNTQAINPLLPGSADGATQAAIDYGMILGGLSQEAQTFNANPLKLVSVLAQDARDGIFDGQDGLDPILLNGSSLAPTAGSLDAAAAISTFSNDVSHNVSGGIVSQTFITSLDNSLNTLLAAMMVPRAGHTATLLPNGQVLITGGFSTEQLPGPALDTAELFDPATNTFLGVPATMQSARTSHTATLLQNGLVLLTGGQTDTNDGDGTNTAELFDPATQTFTPLASTMTSPRGGHTATLLPNGEVLLAGGYFQGINDNPDPHNMAELYDPVSNSFTALANTMTTPRAEHTATLLPNGKVLLTGGVYGSDSSAWNTAELFDPDNNTFVGLASSMTTPRAAHSATLLPDGTVLIAGGAANFDLPISAFNSAELYDPAANTFTALADAMGRPRAWHTSTRLPGGNVLLNGGVTDPIDSTVEFTVLGTAELY